MIQLKMEGLWMWNVLFGLAYIACSCTAQNFYVVAPNVIRLGVNETVAVAMDGGLLGQEVKVYLQDHPGRKMKISENVFQINPDATKIVVVQVLPDDVPDADFKAPNTENYVFLAVESGSFKKEVTIPLSSKSGYVFLQTDKPIYTPKQSVNIRVIPVNEKTLPSNSEFQIQIRNPQNVIVQEMVFNNHRDIAKRAFISHIYKFPPYPMLGIWTVVARHGYQMQHNTSIQFELKEYVLPTFVLDLTVPEVVLPHSEIIEGFVTARYVYGKKVNGIATFKFGVKDETGKVLYFGVSQPAVLEDGRADCKISTRELKDHKSIGWFPQIEGSYLVVEVTVREEASGNMEMIVDHKCRFSKSPFLISFKRSLRDFKPGLVSVIEADVVYVNGRPAPGVKAAVSAIADGISPVMVYNPEAISNDEGKLSFEIHPEMQHKSLKITVKTVDQRFVENQAEGSFMQERFASRSGGYIAISKRGANTIRPNMKFAENVLIHPTEMKNLYYAVVSRGQIIKMDKLPRGQFKVPRVEFEVTFKMVPSFRLIIFAHHNGELISDSLKVDVSNQCHPNAEVVIDPQFETPEPGNVGHIELRGFKDTLVGLLAVDEAVYALRNKDLLTKSKMFTTMESHDMGCGPGGGKNTDTVLGNAGVVIFSNSYSPPGQKAFSTCEEKVRKRRQIKMEYAENFTGIARECCKLGMTRDVMGRSCEDRSDIVKQFLKNDTSNECAKGFLECCLLVQGRGRAGSVSGKGLSAVHNARNIANDLIDELDFVPEVEEDILEKDITVRKDFRETWIFQDIIIGSNNKENLPASLPHSITTWVIQAVSVSHEWGMCVSTPKKLESFKRVFLQLNLPYSVIRNEQIEIQAVVFNYGQQRLPVVVYMYGVKNLCSGTHEGEKSERTRIYVDPQSAQSVTFPVIPLKEGDYDLKVVALSPVGSDAIIRKLNVVPEGYPEERNIPIKLDPTNQQRRAKRSIKGDNFQDFIDDSKNLQITSIELSLPKNFVPGTESCMVSALADEFGPTVETCLQNPDNLLQKSVGCGEQTMIFLAPTMYTMNYLKAKGKITPEVEAKGFGFIRQGYERELTFRTADGAYSAFVSRPASTWLTAFVMKVFCQASKLVHIDEQVMCSGVKWLITNQQGDGSFIDHHPVIHRDMMGGVNGLAPMTAFVLIALQECSCKDILDLAIARARSVQYLENHLAEVVEPLPVAIVSYALALSGSDQKDNAYTKLTALEKYNEDENTLNWGEGQGAHEVELTSYGLLTQLQFNNMVKGNSIVNWLNKKRLASGSFPSTQDTVIALQALSEYEIAAQQSSINLISNITSSNDRHFQKTMMFHDGNSLVLQQLKVDKVGGSLFINTAGQGVGLLSVKLRYNVPTPPEKLCKFHVTVNVTQVKEEEKVPRQPNIDENRPGGKDVFIHLDNDLIRAVGADKDLGEEAPVRVLLDPRARELPPGPRRAPLIADAKLQHHAKPTSSPLIDDDKQQPRVERRFKPIIGNKHRHRVPEDLIRMKRENKPKNSVYILKVEICTRYLGNRDSDMTLIEAGVFSGFIPIKEDLEKLVKSPIDMVQKYEVTSRGVVFYLEKAPKGVPYCFRFRINREYIVGNTQPSAIRVYDYYNPDESCTIFYSSDNTSPMLRKICDNGICQCAEGGCPPQEPFKSVLMLEDADAEAEEIEQAMQEALRAIVCEKNDYVWKGQVVGEIKKEAGFLHVTFLIDGIIKEGIEKADILLGERRTLLARDNCKALIPAEGKKYVIMGKDGQRYLDENGNSWYRYLLDRTSSIYAMFKTPAFNKQLHKTFKFLNMTPREQLCLL